MLEHVIGGSMLSTLYQGLLCKYTVHKLGDRKYYFIFLLNYKASSDSSEHPPVPTLRF